MQQRKRLNVILKLWNVMLRVRVTFSNVGRGVIAPPPPHWPVNQNAE